MTSSSDSSHQRLFVRLPNHALLDRESCLVFLFVACGVAILFAYYLGVARTPRGGSENQRGASVTSVHEGRDVFSQEADQGVSLRPRSFTIAEQEFDYKRIKSAPFSALLTIETTLRFRDASDRPVTKLYSIARDVEGRVRREDQTQSLSNSAEGQKHETVIINDFVASLTYILKPRLQLARISPLNSSMGKKADGAGTNYPRAKADKRYQMLPQGSVSTSSDRPATSGSDSRSTTIEDSLGKKELEGVEVEGTKLTTTIPAGVFGNPKQIVIVEERWYCSELQTMVLIKHSDPRFGDSSYRLTNIVRTEPSHELFVVPSDYKTKNAVNR